MARRYLTAGIPAIPGTIREEAEDFVVEELPGVVPEGAGDHVHFVIEKRGLATMRAVRDIARALGVRPRDLGVAGLKDSRAVTRQTLSVEHVDPAAVLALEVPRIRVLAAERHRRKLRRGQLRGNRFRIRLRGAPPERAPDAAAVLDVLARRGVPNWFGEQRFGERGDTGEIGAALLAEDFDAAASLIAGRPGPADQGAVRLARERYDAGDFAGALEALPRSYHAAARVTRQRLRGRTAREAVLAVEPRMRGFYVSAWQSERFNAVLAARLERIDALLPGEVAWRHGDPRPLFDAPDPDVHADDVATLRVSPTGPLPGGGMREPAGTAAEVERAALEATGAGSLPGDVARHPLLRRRGGRRPLRVPLSDARVEPRRDENGPYLLLELTLPPGAYATVVLEELGKDALEVVRTA